MNREQAMYRVKMINKHLETLNVIYEEIFNDDQRKHGGSIGDRVIEIENELKEERGNIMREFNSFNM